MTLFWILCGGLAFLGLGVVFGAPYVPSRRRDVRRFFETAFPLTKSDVLLDLGSGDGGVTRIVASMGTGAVGYEIHPLFVAVSFVINTFTRSSARVRLRNGWHAPFPDDTTIVYAFVVMRDRDRLVKTIRREATRLGRPLRLISYGNHLKGRTPDFTFEAYDVYTIQPDA